MNTEMAFRSEIKDHENIKQFLSKLLKSYKTLCSAVVRWRLWWRRWSPSEWVEMKQKNMTKLGQLNSLRESSQTRNTENPSKISIHFTLWRCWGNISPPHSGDGDAKTNHPRRGENKNNIFPFPRKHSKPERTISAPLVRKHCSHPYQEPHTLCSPSD